MKKTFRITLNDKTFEVVAEVIGDDTPPARESGAGRRPARSAGAAAVTAPAPKAAPAPAGGGGGDVPSPLAGKVVSIDVSVGDSVTAGQQIATLEAMKMNTVVSSSAAGSVKAIHVAAGDSVEEGQALLTIE
jgi:biotin carboxyl carrier protein